MQATKGSVYTMNVIVYTMNVIVYTMIVVVPKREKSLEGRSMHKNGWKSFCCYTHKHSINWFNTHKICTPNFHSHFSFVNLYSPNSI